MGVSSSSALLSPTLVTPTSHPHFSPRAPTFASPLTTPPCSPRCPQYPLPLPVKRLKLNLALNGFHSDSHVHVVHAAVSNASGEATLFSPAQEQFAAVSSLTRSNMQYYRRTRSQPLLRKTPLLRLDEYFGGAERRTPAGGGGATPLKTAELWGSVGVIKIDVQVCGARLWSDEGGPFSSHARCPTLPLPSLP